MNIESREFRKQDGTRFRVQLYLYLNYKDIQYRVYDIIYCEQRKRKWKSYRTSFSDRYEYRQLNQDDRMKYEIEKYIEFVGNDKLKEAIISAWEALKPDVDEILNGVQ